MSIQQLLTTQADQLEEEIRQNVIEIRRELPRLGYRLKKVYREARDGLIFCAVYERTCDLSTFPLALSIPFTIL